MSKAGTPLDGAERYLWGMLKSFPTYDWRTPHPPLSAEHRYYLERYVELTNAEYEKLKRQMV